MTAALKFDVKSKSTSNQQSGSINQCVLTGGTILPNFITIQFETMEP